MRSFAEIKSGLRLIGSSFLDRAECPIYRGLDCSGPVVKVNSYEPAQGDIILSRGKTP